MKLCVIMAALFGATLAELSLDRVTRVINRKGFHRELETNITYTTDLPQDLEHCAFIVRENITKDHYIYYEEVTKDPHGFQTWPHHKKMNIELPTSEAVDEEFIWKLPLKTNSPNLYITNFESSAAD